MTDSNNAANARQRYDLYVNTTATGIFKVAEAVLLESDSNLVRMGFRYTADYLDHPHAFPLDPIQLPLSAEEFSLPCAGGTPGILDDYLPDDWGRKVLARLAFYQHKTKPSSSSAIDTISLLSGSRIGALQWALREENPDYDLGCDIANMKLAEEAAQSVDDPAYTKGHIDEPSLLYLANAGTGVGGARPKALVYDNEGPRLAKFNRLHGDEYNNARVELACLNMAQAATIECYGGEVARGINGREVLLLDRFDIDANKKDFTLASAVSRKHVITVNALLKSSATQRDKGGVFRYDDVAELVRRHSITVEHDLLQLLKVMIFNRAINNIDDHERNFSFVNDGSGYTLAPAYDMVPSLTTGAYHIAGFQYKPSPPLPSETASLGKIFGLPKTRVSEAAQEVMDAVASWSQIAEQTDVSELDMHNVAKVLRC